MTDRYQKSAFTFWLPSMATAPNANEPMPRHAAASAQATTGRANARRSGAPNARAIPIRVSNAAIE